MRHIIAVLRPVEVKGNSRGIAERGIRRIVSNARMRAAAVTQRTASNPFQGRHAADGDTAAVMDHAVDLGQSGSCRDLLTIDNHLDNANRQTSEIGL